MRTRLVSGVQRAAETARVLATSGLVRPVRPDRLAGMGVALARYGVSLATGLSAGAARHPDQPFLLDDDGTLTWAEVDARTTEIARGLHAQGVERGRAVALLARNGRGFVEPALALAKLGADVLYLNTGFAAPQIADVLERENAAAFIYDPEFAELAAEAAPSVLHVTTDALPRSSDGPLPTTRTPGRQVLLTSGTTGKPKGAARSSAGLGDAVALLSRIPLKAGETTLIASPLFHTWGFAHFSLGLALGSTLVLQRKFDPEQTLAAIEQHRVSGLAVVPVMMQRLASLPEETRRRYDTSSLRVVATSGSALSAALARRFQEEYGDVVYNLYGSTEVAYAAIATPAELHAAPGTVGRPPVGTTVRLYDDDGRPVPDGEIGRIFVGNAMVFGGYTGGGDKDRIDGLVSTGDVGRFDENGLLFVEGRDDDMIVSGGENVFPAEVEEVIGAHEGVQEVAVVGVPDDDYGQRLKAFVVREPGASVEAKDLSAAVKSRLARFKVPREIVFVDELPRNATGKVLHRELREE